VNVSLVFDSENVQFAVGVSSKCHRIKEKGTVPKLTKAKSLFVGVGGLRIFPKKSSHIEKAQRIYLYINKSL